MQTVFKEPPEHYNPRLEVAACFLTVDESVLFMKRQPHKSEGSLWGIPGGRFEKGEAPHQTVVREIREETGIEVQSQLLQYLSKVYIRLPDVDFTYHMFAYALEKIPSKIQIDPAEHTEYRWITLQEALKLPLIRGEAECIHLAYGKEPTVSNQLSLS